MNFWHTICLYGNELCWVKGFFIHSTKIVIMVKQYITNY